MNVKRQLALATSFGGLWHQLMPEFAAPDRDQLLLWAGTYTEQDVVHGINRAARKSRKLRDTDSPMTLTDAIRYASSVMKNEKCGFRRFPHGEDFMGNISQIEKMAGRDFAR
jgi:hypothetical protein